MNKILKHKLVAKSLKSQKIRFIFSGLANTALDFLIFNLLLLGLGLPLLVSNIISVSIVMTFSYFVNGGLVFEHKKRTMRHFVLFISITLVSVWGIQSLSLYLTKLGFNHVTQIPFTHVHLALPEWMIDNIAKVIATVAGAVWNYIWYKEVIFKKRPEQSKTA